MKFFTQDVGRFVIATIAASFLMVSVFAQDADQLVDVVVTGHGSTVREATRAAFRSAVEHVVGTLVDATTIVENDKLIEDEILTYSAGMVASSKQIGEPKKISDGFVSVKVKVTVKKGQLREKLRAASTVNVALDGDDLFARMTAAKDNLSDAEAIIKAVLAKHTACVVAEAVPGKTGNSPIDLDPKTGEMFVNVRVRIDQTKYTQFANEVVEKIGPMSTGKIKLNSRGNNGDRYKPDGRFDFEYNLKDYPFLVMTSLKTGSATAFHLDKNILNAIVSSLDTGSLAVAVTLYDALGMEIAESTKALCEDRLSQYQSYEASIFACCEGSKDFGCIVPFYRASPYRSNDSLQAYGSQSVGTYRISLGSFSSEELKRVGKLKVKVGHMKGNQFME